jgi:inner membrane protein involved in colicin E2 resistance
MKEEIDENKEKEVIQKAYKYNIFLGIWIIAVFIIFLLQITKIITDQYLTLGFGLIILIYAIALHTQNHKLKIKSIASILVYGLNILSVIGVVLIILANQAHNLLELAVGVLLGLVTLILQVLAAIFALLPARKLRKLYPDILDNRRKNTN